MAAEVSSLVRILNGYSSEEQQQQQQMKSANGNNKSKVLFTRDLLGGCSSSSMLGSKELDLDLQVPNGWEKRLDMKSGKVYIQRCNSSISSSSSSDHHQQQQKQSRMVPELLQDLNFPPLTTITTASKNNLFEESCLDLKLVPSYDNYQYSSSVCTLDKVKFALERAEKESIKKKRLPTIAVAITDGGTSSSSSSSPSLIKEEDDLEEKRSCSSSTNSSSLSSSGLLFAAGCPGCLFYVLISRSNPKCPRCDSIVSSPVMKKPRIDLNASV